MARRQVHWAKASVAEGSSLDDVAAELVESGLSPIAAIKVVRDAAGVTLGEAKTAVHRNLSLDQQRAAEHLWDEAIAWLEAEQ
jgi:ribosomal protein L7/L12